MTRLFSDDQLEQLRSFPDIGRDDLIRFFTLTPADVAFIDPAAVGGPGSALKPSAPPSPGKTQAADTHGGDLCRADVTHNVAESPPSRRTECPPDLSRVPGDAGISY
ncbi:hypothetical protein ACQEU6_39710 [Spirillospora sp. CA-108201]